MYPYANPSLFSRGLGLSRGIGLAKSINWGGILDGTQKTLGVINQAIPIVYQVKPILNNAKTMLRIASQMATPEVNNSPTITTNNPIQNQPSTSLANQNNLPIFYI